MPSVDTVNVAGRNGVQTVTALDSLLVDVTAIRAAVLALTAKLDADGDVAGTDYAELWDPAALTTTT